LSTGPDSRRSSPLPCGIPSTRSTRTTSASSLFAIRSAQLAPTLPAPTTVTLLRMNFQGIDSAGACQAKWGVGLVSYFLFVLFLYSLCSGARSYPLSDPDRWQGPPNACDG